MRCPHCNASDAGSGKFCIHCGMALPLQPVSTTQQPDQAGSLMSREDTSPQPLATRRDVELPQKRPATERPVAPMGPTTTAPASIWGPFAGYGTRGRHVAWLLDDLGHRAEDLRQAVTARFQQRRIPGADVIPRILTAKGVLVEQRPYYLVQRGRATAGLYLARFGEDIYISQVTYFKSPVSTVRILIAAALIAFIIAYPAMLSSAADDVSADLFGGVYGAGELARMLCCLGPFYLVSFLVLTLVALMSLWKFITEKDLLAPLRVQPNEFDQDDLIALEKAVEQTVRESLDVVGIDRQLMPPAARYGLRGRII